MKEQHSLPVYSTEDYSIFKKLSGNRDLYPNQVKKLVRVIDADKDFTKKNPLKVNEKMEVIDGQHRLAAYELYVKKTGNIPSVYFTISKGATLKDARSMNAGSKAWIPRDYARAFAEDGNENYKTYLAFEKKYKIQHNVLARYLGEDEGRKSFRDGGFVVKNERAARVLIEQLVEVGPMYISWPSQSFGVAFHKIANSKLYDHDRMMEQMTKFSEALNNVPSRVKELIPALNMVYSFKNKQKVDLLNK
jgi:hypothetical protein